MDRHAWKRRCVRPPDRVAFTQSILAPFDPLPWSVFCWCRVCESPCLAGTLPLGVAVLPRRRFVRRPADPDRLSGLLSGLGRPRRRAALRAGVGSSSRGSHFRNAWTSGRCREAAVVMRQQRSGAFICWSKTRTSVLLSNSRVLPLEICREKHANPGRGDARQRHAKPAQHGNDGRIPEKPGKTGRIGSDLMRACSPPGAPSQTTRSPRRRGGTGNQDRSGRYSSCRNRYDEPYRPRPEGSGDGTAAAGDQWTPERR